MARNSVVKKLKKIAKDYYNKVYMKGNQIKAVCYSIQLSTFDFNIIELFIDREHHLKTYILCPGHWKSKKKKDSKNAKPLRESIRSLNKEWRKKSKYSQLTSSFLSSNSWDFTHAIGIYHSVPYKVHKITNRGLVGIGLAGITNTPCFFKKSYQS